MKISSLAVFCGSKPGNNPLFSTHTRELASLMAERNITLIYGGGKRGIMGLIADTLLEKNGKVVGIIPEVLLEWESQHEGITELVVVKDMHTRKKQLYERCDAAIILPGGFGTLDELFEMLTWNQLSIHDKDIFLLNTDGFYNHLVEHLKKMEAEGFLYEKAKERIIILSKPEELISYL
jgi:uncharacterized protein (TIGR00730 family)